jgi:hypothetical protein
MIYTAHNKFDCNLLCYSAALHLDAEEAGRAVGDPNYRWLPLLELLQLGIDVSGYGSHCWAGIAGGVPCIIQDSTSVQWGQQCWYPCNA